MSALCLDMNIPSTPQSVLGTFAAFTVVKTQLNNDEDTIYSIVEGDASNVDFVENTNYVSIYFF